LHDDNFSNNVLSVFTETGVKEHCFKACKAANLSELKAKVTSLVGITIANGNKVMLPLPYVLNPHFCKTLAISAFHQTSRLRFFVFSNAFWIIYFYYSAITALRSFSYSPMTIIHTYHSSLLEFAAETP
jgi:hypothetical protein